MVDTADMIADVIVNDASKRVNKIAKYMAQKVQDDFVKVVYVLLDSYYQDYTPENGRKYIRVDELHTKLSAQKRKAAHKRGRDISLRSYILSMDADGSPAIGVCQPYGNGYLAGVLFDSSKVKRTDMRHYGKGKPSHFGEFDIIENFVYGQHGGRYATNYGGAYQSRPYVDLFLTNRMNSYDTMMTYYFNQAKKIYG